MSTIDPSKVKAGDTVTVTSTTTAGAPYEITGVVWEPSHSPGTLWVGPVSLGAAALATECHEAVVPEWADGEEMPCNASDVVGYRLDEGQPYPVCAEHMRAPMVPLHVALLGDPEWLRDAEAEAIS